MTVVFGRLEVRFMSARSECADRAVRRRTWVSPSTVSMVRSPLRGALSASQSVDVKPDSAEVVFLGEILGATGFSDSCVHGGVMCRWQVVHGEHWNLKDIWSEANAAARRRRRSPAHTAGSSRRGRTRSRCPSAPPACRYDARSSPRISLFNLPLVTSLETPPRDTSPSRTYIRCKH